MSLDQTLVFEFDYGGEPINLDSKLFHPSVTLNAIGDNDLQIPEDTIVPRIVHNESGTEYGPKELVSKTTSGFKVRYKIANGIDIN